ncbi:hypothetical protein TFLX_05463 [Thermoflexales bacterium]|nr:hypothetical protein TFLX_05463 [Thermoflexales bacterium]
MAHKILLTLVIALTLLSPVANPALAAKAYRAERFDVQFDVQPDGSALVTETVVFRFEGGSFTYAFREIDPAETDGITFIDASLDGQVMPLGTNAGQVEVAGVDPLKVKWHFEPTSDAAHQFIVRYRVAGIVRKLDADTIRWRAIPQAHDYPIERSSITITYPATARLIESPSLDREFEVSSRPNGARLTTTNIPVDQDVILTARFAVGTAATTAPGWQIQQQQANAAAARAFPIGLFTAALTLTLGGFGLFAYARAQRRESISSIPVWLETPPAELPPALVGKLTQHSQGFMGTLFDLAQRGVLEVHQNQGRWGSKKYMLELKHTAAPLNAHEQGLLTTVFKPGETAVDMSAIPTRLSSKHKAFEAPLEQELIDRGWLDPERKRQRTKIGVTGFLSMLAALGLFFIGLLGVGAAYRTDVDQAVIWAALIGLAAGGSVIAIGVLIYYATFSPLTPEGEAEAARWTSFAKYLKQASKNQQATLSSDYFERYLRWAAAFGLGGAWAKYFQRVGGAPLPVWFHAMPGSHGDFGAVVAAMSASDSAGASAASGGGAGASGGGASGAG